MNDLSAADICEAVAEIKADAIKRGLGVCYVDVGVDTIHDHNVDGTISLYENPNITASGDDFRSCVENLRAALHAYIPDEQRLAEILGIPLQAAAE